MFGNQISAGLLAKSIGYILANYSINVSVTELIGQEYYDLTSGKKVFMKEYCSKPAVFDSVVEFNKFVTKMVSIRMQKPTNQNRTSSRSHLMFKFGIEGGISRGNMAFFDLAGWESPNDKPDIEETKFINSTLTELNGILANIAKNKILFFKSKLSKLFKPYLCTTDSKIIMFYHISNATAKKGIENIKDIVASAKRMNQRAFRDITNKRLTN